MSVVKVSESPNTINEYPRHIEGDIECIDCIENSMSVEAFQGYLKGSILKHVLQYRHEHNPLKDLMQARWYLDKLIESVQNDIADRFDP
jgi:hypothetical protein